MVFRRDSGKTGSESPLRIWLMAGACFVVLAACVVTVSTRTVHADARLPRPAATANPALPAANATPASLAPQKPAGREAAKMLRGVASWYGGVFNGRNTASGERFDMYAMTACHPTLPFGSVVRVVNLENSRSVVVRITDRGELVEGRIIDLSYGAAQKLLMTRPGLVPVKLEVLSLGGQDHKK
jgi:rare lipoprotein A